MSSESIKQKILTRFYRQSFPRSVLEFYRLIYDIVRKTTGMTEMEAERFVAANRTRYWNWFKKEQDSNRRRGLYPFFVIKDEVARRVSWFAANPSQLRSSKQKKKAVMLASRPSITRRIDTLDDREYEALACVICRLLRADRVRLTPSGNEGGIDFFASTALPTRSHILCSATAPLRIVGQCKKHNRKVQVGWVKEFALTIEQVKHQHPPLTPLVPAWFRSTGGPIIGWMIAHRGFQRGAESLAKSHGIVLSDSRDLVEIASLSRSLMRFASPRERAECLAVRVREELDLYRHQGV